jgi:hypothetical protein
MVLTVSFVLSPATGLSCHRRLRNTFRKLDASVGASGPHDFAVRQNAARLASPKRPPHPALYVRDDRETPLERRRDRIAISLNSTWPSSEIRKIRNWRPPMLSAIRSLSGESGRDADRPIRSRMTQTRRRATNLPLCSSLYPLSVYPHRVGVRRVLGHRDVSRC